MMDAKRLLEDSEPFLRYLADWEAQLAEVELAQLAAEPARVAIISVDVIHGFCYTGPLASPRVQRIIAPIVTLFERAHTLGVPHIVLVQEAHEPDAVEFGQFPPHGVRGTVEAEPVPEIKGLPFFDEMTVVAKNSIHPAMNTGLDEWLRAHPGVDTFIAVGDCTDLCTYQLAMHLRLRANAHQLRQRIIVPANCVDTYDLPVAAAQSIGAVPHSADLLHLVFLYSMSLNGVEVVRAMV
jgi:nicotinamidase-related amidase